MATIRVEHSIGDLARDCAKVSRGGKPAMARVVKASVKQGEREAKRFAKASSGPHGSNYFKRIGSEMTSPLSGEFGPHGDVAGNAVGGGWRTGGPNTDLPRAADIVAPKMAADALDAVAGLFW